MADFVTKDSKTAAYLIFKGKELLKMGRDDVGDFTFSFSGSGEINNLVREFPLTPFKQYLDVYRAVVRSVKEVTDD